jgi:hypothetical protein
MIFRCYGLFWRRDEINWHPGTGKKGEFRLLGRRGANNGHLRVADFREQIGIYILYGDLGPYYVGLTREQSFGDRLRSHCSDKHANKWDRFSWFGFRAVLGGRDENRFQRLKAAAGAMNGKVDGIIGDVEAVLIKSMALDNVNQMKFAHDGAKKPWLQIRLDEIHKYRTKLA